MLTVNKEKVPQALIDHEYERLLPHYKQRFKNQPEEEQKKQLGQWAKQNVIEQVLLQQAAKKRKDKISKKEIAKRLDKLIQQSGGEKGFKHNMRVAGTTEEKLAEEIKLQIKVEHLLERVGKRAPVITEEDAEQHYSAHIDSFMIPEMVHAAHIVKHVRAPEEKEPAKKAIEQCKKEMDDGKTFEDVASENSDCPERAGDLGYFPRGQMVQTFEEKVFAMKKGEVSDIFLTEFGYHIVKKYDHIPARPRPFEQVKDELVKKLQEDARQKEIEKYLDNLTAKAEIQQKD